jgi:hypothetical protein
MRHVIKAFTQQPSGNYYTHIPQLWLYTWTVLVIIGLPYYFYITFPLVRESYLPGQAGSQDNEIIPVTVYYGFDFALYPALFQAESTLKYP